MPLNIVLIEPEIPNNTGNIGRLALATGATLHLVKPFGFELSDKRLKRAGLDYWAHISLCIYESSDAFFAAHASTEMVFLSSHGTQSYWDINFEDDIFLVFGKESKGLSKEIIKKNQNRSYKIPMYSEYIRSLNLANSVAIVTYEALRSIQN